MKTPTDMECSRTHTDGTAPEQASDPVPAFQEKMERWTDRVGYGAKRGLICAWGLATVLVIFLIAQAVLTHSYGKHDTDTLGEFLVKLLFLAVGPSVFFPPVGVIVGAFLGAAGIIRKEETPPEPPSSASEPPSSKPER